MSDKYYNREDLQKFNNGEIGNDRPELWDEFMKFYGDVFAEGSLTSREKSMIALGVALAIPCPYCIEAYTADCLSKGLSSEQLTEVMQVASAIRGGATMAHGIQMRNIIDELEF